MLRDHYIPNQGRSYTLVRMSNWTSYIKKLYHIINSVITKRLNYILNTFDTMTCV